MCWAARFAIAAFHLHAFFPTCLCLPPPPPPDFKTPAWEGPALSRRFRRPENASNRLPTLARPSESNVFLFKALKKLTPAAADLLLARCLAAATLSHDTLPLPAAAVGLPEGGGEGQGGPTYSSRGPTRRSNETDMKILEPPRSSPAGNAERLRREVLAAVHAVCSVF